MKAFVNIKFLIFGCIATSITLILVGIFFMKKGNKEILYYQFNGKVDSVWYDENSSVANEVTKPFVKIDGKTFYLFYHTWDFGYKIQKGDSLKKKKNTLIVTFIKSNGKTYIYGK
jgi:hypothetical protein